MARHPGPSFFILDARPFTKAERAALQALGKWVWDNQQLLTLSCGHHVIRVNPNSSGASRAICRLPHP